MKNEAPYKEAGQNAHPHMLIGVFIVRQLENNDAFSEF